MATTRDPSPDLAERYGTHRPVRRLALVIVTVVVAGAGLGWLVWAAWLNSDAPIRAGIEGYEVTSTHRVTATVQVSVRDRFTRGHCVLQATASDHAVVGERAVPISRAGRLQVVVRTEREATTVEVASCSAQK